MAKRFIGLLGGTFDPVHNGHIYLAELAMQELSLDEVWLIPASEPNFKQGEVSSSIEDRLKMCELATTANDRIKVCDIEAKREGITYSVDTVREIMNTKAPDDEFVFLIGEDAASKLTLWRGAQELAVLIPFKVFKRSGSTDANNFERFSEETLQNLRDFGFNVEFFEAAIPPFSSSELRQSLKNRTAANDALNPSVLKYIQQRNLYE